MAKQDIDIGAFPGDQSPGVDVVRSAFKKAKENFDELYARAVGDMNKSVYDSDNTGVVDSADKIEGVDDFTGTKYYGTDENGVPGFFDLIIKADNIVFYTDAQPRPLEGTQNVVYIDKTNKKIEVWDGTKYQIVAGGTVTAASIEAALGYMPDKYQGWNKKDLGDIGTTALEDAFNTQAATTPIEIDRNTLVYYIQEGEAKRAIFVGTPATYEGSATLAVAGDFEVLGEGSGDSGGGGGSTEITFTEVVKLDSDKVATNSITGDVAYTFDSTDAKLGAKRIDYLVANGINKPTFSSDFTIRYDGWDNTQNKRNRVYFEYTGNKVLVDIIYL